MCSWDRSSNNWALKSFILVDIVCHLNDHYHHRTPPSFPGASAVDWRRTANDATMGTRSARRASPAMTPCRARTNRASVTSTTFVTRSRKSWQLRRRPNCCSSSSCRSSSSFVSCFREILCFTFYLLMLLLFVVVVCCCCVVDVVVVLLMLLFVTSMISMSRVRFKWKQSFFFKCKINIQYLK